MYDFMLNKIIVLIFFLLLLLYWATTVFSNALIQYNMSEKLQQMYLHKDLITSALNTNIY